MIRLAAWACLVGGLLAGACVLSPVEDLPAGRHAGGGGGGTGTGTGGATIPGSGGLNDGGAGAAGAANFAGAAGAASITR